MESILIAGILIVLAAIIALEIRFPVAILEILMGIIASNLLNLHITPEVEFLSDLGILAIIFLAGLEIDKDILKKYMVRSVAWASLIYGVQLLIVTVLMLALGYLLMQAFLVAIAMSATSLALAYTVVRERGIIKFEAGQTILSVAMIIDVASMLSLLFYLEPEYEIWFFVYGLIAILLIAFSPKLSEIIFSRYEGNIAELEIRIVLLFLLIIGFIAEYLGISEVIFAFFLGFVMASILTDRKDVEDKLKGIVFGFLAPVFFFEAGMLIDLRVITSDVIILVVLLVVIVFLIAFLLSYIVFTRSFGRDFGICSGLIFNFRLSFSIVAAFFGLTMGIIDEVIYVTIMISILVTSLAAAIALRLKHTVALLE